MGKILYRKLLKEAKNFPAQNVSRKLTRNIRDLFCIYRSELDERKVEALIEDGYTALRVLKSLRQLSDKEFDKIFSDFK